MLPVVCPPIENEFLYSWKLRLAAANAFVSYQRFSNEFCQTPQNAVVFSGETDKKGNREVFSSFYENLGIENSATEVFLNMTCYGGLAPFLSKEKQVLHVNSAFRNRILGSAPNSLTPTLKFCPECWKELPIYFCQHQMPGVRICNKHHCLLCIRSGDEAIPCEPNAPSDIMERYATFAQDMLLLKPDADIQATKKAIFNAIKENGYYSPSSKYSNLQAAIPTSNGVVNSHHYLSGNTASGTNTSFALLGYSGCGKSSALKVLLEHYPQVIYHYDAYGGRYPQIVYIALNCVPNSNFSALYSRIGEAIDRALGLHETTPYQKMIDSKRSLGEKANCIRKLIEVFSIGAIVLDEIQLINFETTKENSFEALMMLANETKVAFVVVGTEDAYEKMFKTLRTARRVGTIINGNAYCDNFTFFSYMVRALFRYQWFEGHMELTNEIATALYEVSKGIVRFLINAYMEMHKAYYDESPRPVVDANFIRNTVRKRMEKIYELLSDTSGFTMSENDDIDLYFDTKRQEQFAQEFLELQEAADRLRENVIRNVAKVKGSEYSLERISAAYAKVTMRKNQNMSEADLTKATIKMLMKAPSKRKRQTIQAISLEDLRKDVLND